MFPVKTMLAVAALVALLIVPRWIPHLEAWASLPPESVVPAIAKVWDLPVPEPPIPAMPSLEQLEREREAALAPEHMLDLGRPLDHFFEALHRLEEQGGTVRVAHFGDSPTTADLITADARDMLQKQFGDGGHGYLLAVRPWAWYNHRLVKMEGSGWKIEIAGVTATAKKTGETAANTAADTDGAADDANAARADQAELKSEDSIDAPREAASIPGSSTNAVQATPQAATQPRAAGKAPADSRAVPQVTAASDKQSAGPPSGPKGVFGIGGARFRGYTGATAKWSIRGQSSAEISFLAGPQAGAFELLADGQVVGATDVFAVETTPAWVTFALPAGTSEFTLRVTSGQVTLFGVEFRRDQRGVIYSSLGINGASITMLSRIFSGPHLSTVLRHYRPDLVVLAYGTNESGYPAFVDNAFAGELRNAMRRVRGALPNASILVMSPMDRGEKKEDGSIGTLDALERLVAIESRIAAEEKVGFFNTFEAMGGRGTMAKWYSGTPRLVGADLIHPMPAGARIVGELLYSALAGEYQEYESRRQSLSEAKLPAETGSMAH